MISGSETRCRPAALLALLVLAGVSLASTRPASDARAAETGEGARVFLPLAARGFDVSERPGATVVTPVPFPSATPTAVHTAGPEPSPTPTASPTPTGTPEGYREELTDFPDLADLRASYSEARWYPTMLEVLERRYETGHYIVTQLQDSEANARRWVGNRTGSWQDLMTMLQLVVHEMNHQLGMQEGVLKTRFGRYAFVVRADETVTVPYIETYPRSEIARYVIGPLENMYKSVYLSGRSGEQGVQNLLDEVNAYTHSLFTAYGVHDQFPSGLRASHRDGLVTFMMYTQFYLRHAREHHPDDWDRLHDDPEMRSLVALLWARAEFILETTEDMPGLAMNPEAIEAEMRKADMQDEISRFVAP